MKLFKPKFWDKKKINFIAIILIPFSYIVRFFAFIKMKFTKEIVFKIPIICIGNIYLGGTGKTPLSIKIFEMLKKNDKNPVIIKKFYKNQFDEVDLIKDNCKEVIYEKSRTQSLKLASSKLHDIAILDDGLQDHSIKKDVCIVCFHENQLVGNGLTIPAGPLREKLSAIKNYQIIIINGNKNLEFEKKITDISKDIEIFYSQYNLENVEYFENKKLYAFAGIGNPDNFFSLIKKNNLNLLKFKSFPDHYIYTQSDINNLIKESKKDNLEL